MNRTFADVVKAFREFESFRRRHVSRKKVISVRDEFDLFVQKFLEKRALTPDKIPHLAPETPLLDNEPGDLAVIRSKLAQ
jgi:hypothetical protein